MRMLLCFGPMSCCRNRTCFRCSSWTDDQPTYNMPSHPGPSAETHPHTITLPPPCLPVGMMFLL
ncbi:hypothetical protein COCON_G00021180 [Conger conger]|uniref:Uncharacterized protein n=1 Tax=Conger conger TaxID=82655 RepID=A0A9Q1DWY2_CONCO|nr:hypothetical protein COCON_G00021180 [Conger conger]